MKVIIAGSRGFTDYNYIKKAIESWNINITEVVSGRCRGVDKLGEEWAKKNHVRITYFPADWNKYGKSAGYIRNQVMAKYADVLIAIWDGESKGTKHMIEISTKLGLEVHVSYRRNNK